MDLEQLASLVAVAETGGISAAARERHLSQPAVSLQIKALEADLGVRLLDRGPRGAVLTQAGAAVLVHARRMLRTVRTVQAEVAELQGLERGSIRLGTTDAAATGILPEAFFTFHRRHPAIEVAVDVGSTWELIAGLRTDRFDLALGTLPIEDPEILVRPLATERLALGVPVALAAVPPSELLETEPFIAYPRDSVTRRLVDQALDQAGLRVRPVMEIGRPSVMVRLVEAGLGVSVLPEAALQPAVERGTLARLSPRGFQVVRSLGLLLLRGRDLEPASRALVALLEEGALPD